MNDTSNSTLIFFQFNFFILLLFHLIICSQIKQNNTKEVVLFSSSGCYSHDVMMRQVGEEFEIATTNITWMQIFMYDFGFGQIKRPKQWKSVVLDRTGREETRLIREGGALLWETTIPVDHDRLWDVRGSLLFINILQRNQKLCEEFLKMPKFHHFMQTNRATLLVVDHFIQECFSMTASLLNVTTVQFSNWPIADGYITSLNVPAPPSAFPKTGTMFSSRGMTSFWTRLRNSFFHTCIVIARSIQNWVINAFYARMGYPQVEMNDVESKHIFYAGRSEFVVEVVRPISNRIKHFGCIDCSAPEEHWIKQPAMARLSIYPTTHSHPEGHHANVDRNASPPLHNSSVSITLNNNTTCSCAATCHRIIRLPNKIDFEAQEITNRRISNTSLNDSFIKAQQNVRRVANETVLEQRYLVTQSEYPDIDLGMLEIHRFVLVSFGSVAKMEFMPDILLDTFLWAFSNCTRTILWQTNSPRKIIEQRLKGRRVPPNVHLLQWAPIRILLAHHNLHYAILHGGINTINEVLMFGVPVLGVPLQGDQPSNLQRLVELGVGQIIDIKGIWNGQFPAVMNDMEKNHVQYANRAKMISSMVKMHRNELPVLDRKRNTASTIQGFWLHWAERHGHRIKSAKFFHLRYRGVVEHFALLELSLLFSLIIGALLLIC